jgi:hypothetical protein
MVRNRCRQVTCHSSGGRALDFTGSSASMGSVKDKIIMRQKFPEYSVFILLVLIRPISYTHSPASPRGSVFEHRLGRQLVRARDQTHRKKVMLKKQPRANEYTAHSRIESE